MVDWLLGHGRLVGGGLPVGVWSPTTVAVSIDRAGEISHAELHFTDAARKGEVSWGEMSVPGASRRGQFSWAEARFPVRSAKGEISWAEVKTKSLDRAGETSWAELHFPGPVVVDPDCGC